MSENTETSSAHESTIAKMSPVDKAAAFMIALGQDSASEVYKYLKEEEVEKISLQISRINSLPSETYQEIMEEFYDLCIAQKIVTEGGQEYAMGVLMKAFGKEKAKSLMNKVASAGKTRSFDFLKKVDNKNLLMMLQNEMPQTIALVLSYVEPLKAAKIIAELPHDTQVEIFKRIADLDSTSPEVLKEVEDMMLDKIGTMASVDQVETGGVNYLAEVMNNLDMRTEKDILDDLSSENQELADEIKKRMFVFEDIVYLDNLEIQAFIRVCDTKDLTVALKGTNSEVANAIFSNMSQRQQETIKTDMQYLHNIRMRDVEEAQQRIIAVIRQLEETGQIIISKGGMDEIIP